MVGVEVGPGAGGRLHDRDEAGRADAAHLPADGAARAEGRHSRTASSTSCRATVRRPARRSSSIRASTRSRSPAKARRRRSSRRRRAETMKRVTFELGGKSPNVVFADADLDAAVRGRPLRPVLQPGPVLLCGQPAVRRGEGVTTSSSTGSPTKNKTTQGRRSVRPGDGAGPAGRQGAVRQDPASTSTTARQDGAKLRDRRQARRRQGLLRRADDVRRRDGRHEDRPRGDLRPGDERAEVQERRRDHRAGERHELRPGGGGVDARHRQGPSLCQAKCGPARCGSTATTCSTRRPRSAASRRAASAANWARPGCDNYTESKTVTVSLADSRSISGETVQIAGGVVQSLPRRPLSFVADACGNEMVEGSGDEQAMSSDLGGRFLGVAVLLALGIDARGSGNCHRRRADVARAAQLGGCADEAAGRAVVQRHPAAGLDERHRQVHDQGQVRRPTIRT